jgi:hypothetical protein
MPQLLDGTIVWRAAPCVNVFLLATEKYKRHFCATTPAAPLPARPGAPASGKGQHGTQGHGRRHEPLPSLALDCLEDLHAVRPPPRLALAQDGRGNGRAALISYCGVKATPSWTIPIRP